MDSRIEELATIIQERASSTADLFMEGGDRGDSYHSYRSLEALARNMLRVIKEYRADHPKEYEDPSKHLHEQIVSLRSKLARYEEREATMGWSKQ